jgi:hypothetical protein
MLAAEWHWIGESSHWAFRPHRRQKLRKLAMNCAYSDAPARLRGVNAHAGIS